MHQEYDIKYDYYPIQCMNTMKADDSNGQFIKATFLGKLNQPNIVLAKTNSPYTTYYHSSKLTLAGSSNILPTKTSLPAHDAQLILEHEPSTTDKTLIVIFLLKASKNGLEKQIPIENLSKGENVTLELNKFLESLSEPKMEILAPKSEQTMYLIFTDPIPISLNLTGMFTDYFHQMDKVTSSFPFQSNLLGEFSTGCDSNRTTTACALKLPKQTHLGSVDIADLPHPSNKLLQEGFVEGNTNPDPQNLVCELMDVPQEDMVNVIMVPENSLAFNELVSTGFGDVALNLQFVLFASIFSFLIGPFIYVWFRNLFGNISTIGNNNQMSSIGRFWFVKNLNNAPWFNPINRYFMFNTQPALYDLLFGSITFVAFLVCLATGFAMDNLILKALAFMLLYVHVFNHFGVMFYYAIRPDERKQMVSDDPYPFPAKPQMPTEQEKN